MPASKPCGALYLALSLRLNSFWPAHGLSSIALRALPAAASPAGRPQALEAKHSTLEAEHAEARRSLSELSEQLQRSAEAAAALEAASVDQHAQQAIVLARLQAAEAAAAERGAEAERAAAALQKAEAERAAAQQQAEGLAGQLAAAQERGVRAEVSGLITMLRSLLQGALHALLMFTGWKMNATRS